ncbi:MAG: serine/threonine protein phosphatase [Saprospiraceae bacterium]|nr:serine/threonine protein phosphatase [Saprospiraceae bacterium]
MRIFAISDIHGCKNTLLALLDKIALSPSDTLYLLGDYINRGPDSKGVIDLIWALSNQGYTLKCLRGNHEQMLLNKVAADHKQTGPGLETQELLHSFGVARALEIPKEYLKWMGDLPHLAELPGYILVHAGLNFQVADSLADTTSMLWIRQWHDLINQKWLGERVIVHGHTPQPHSQTIYDLGELDRKPALCIDCGCALVQAPYGQLCAFDLGNRTLYFQNYKG